jgi:hypothetical protein
LELSNPQKDSAIGKREAEAVIHNVEIPETTLAKLAEIVHIQMTLLAFAASKQDLSLEKCAEYLQNEGIDRNKPGRSRKIARWIWRVEGRRENLKEFAKGIKEEKLHLVSRLRHEIQLLFEDPPIGYVDIVEAPKDSWQEKGVKFLRKFYDDLSKSKLPECLFSELDAKDYNRQTFLKDYLEKNNILQVCPICDESGSYTSSNGNIYTDIEHYLPQSLYPHFACHPYNLIPICHLCNSAIHGDEDPLQPDKNNPRNRLQLQNIILPYRGLSLGAVTRLDIKLDNTAQLAAFRKLISTDKQNDYKTQIETLDRIYKIPGRWNKHHEIDKVGETLFRRMRQFLRGTYELPVGDSLQDVLFDAIHQLLYFLYRKGEEGHKGGDYGKDPYAFAMTWLLVEMLKEEKQYSEELKKKKEQRKNTIFTPPLLDELASWLGQNINSQNDYTELANKLLNMVSSENAESQLHDFI